jgi:hypothetical protein
MALSRQSETCQRKPPRSAQETRSTPQGCGFKYVAGVLDATRDGAAPAARRASACAKTLPCFARFWASGAPMPPHAQRIAAAVLAAKWRTHT